MCFQETRALWIRARASERWAGGNEFPTNVLFPPPSRIPGLKGNDKRMPWRTGGTASVGKDESY